jgi:hypothetical protein
MIKSLKKLEIEETHLNISKGCICDKHIANIVLNGGNLKPFSLKSETRKSVHSPHSYWMWCYNKIRERNKRDTNREEEIKFSLFADYSILYLKNPNTTWENI